MATSAGALPRVGSVAAARTTARVRAAGAPWYVWCGVLAVTSSSIGGAWDVAWHRSIGRDSFWTGAHMAIYACGLLAAVVCGYLIFRTTFGRAAGAAELRAVSVNVLGFRAPLGAFVAAWGGIAMMASGPFDNWWHAAYGLDVKIVSLPHTILILGIRAVAIGVMFLILAAMNRAAENGTGAEVTLRRLFLYLGGLMVGGQMFFLLEFTWDVKLHSASAYVAMGIALPLVFAVLWRASGYRWTATVTASIYMAIAMAEEWILPLFPASPKLGPVYFPVTHLVPAKFPILLVPAAWVLDLFWQWARKREWKSWQVAAVSGVLFTAVLAAVEWPFASFLVSKASENRFFGTIYFDYNSRPDWFDRMRRWFKPDTGWALWRGLGLASVCGMVGTWVGMKFGGWMRTVQR